MAVIGSLSQGSNAPSISTAGTAATSSASSAAACPSTPVSLPAPLGSFGVLAGSTVVNVAGASTVTGNLGLWPGSSVVGFPPGVVTGTQYVGPGPAQTAQGQLTTAFNQAAGYPVGSPGCGGTLTGGQNIAGMTFTPGVWTSGSTLYVTGGPAYLNGPGTYIFQIGSALTVNSGAGIILQGGAQASDVFWVVGSSATLGTTTSMQGTILAADSITMDSGASLVGRTLAESAEVSISSTTIVVPTPASAANYTVTFTESHLTSGANWSVTLNGVLNSSRTSTIGFSVVNGTYNFTVGTQAGFTVHPSRGNLTVAGASVSVPIAFSPNVLPTYAVVFTESGLANTTNWSVVLNGVLNSSRTSTIGFSVVNGTYNFTVGTQAGFTAHPSRGNLTVAGASVSVPIAFSPNVLPTYAVVFTESGLANTTNWSVVLNGVLNNSRTSTIGFSVANGTYNFTAATTARYTASPGIGNITVHGAAVNTSILFTPGLPATYAVTFNESGLPSGTSWAVTLNGFVKHSLGTTIQFNTVNGTYNYSVGLVSGYYKSVPSAGTVTVHGAAVDQAVTFTAGAAPTFAVNFTESGLHSGTNWSVTLNGVRQNSTNATIGFVMVNGSYSYTVGAVAGRVASPAYGTVAVNGTPVQVAIAFSVGASFLVTFVETGLPVGMNWSVTLHGISHSSVVTTVRFSIPNGTYNYMLGAVAGYVANPLSGNETVRGAPVSQGITFTAGGPSTYGVTFTETGLPAGSSWSVALNGVIGNSTKSVPSAIVFLVANGTYPFVVESVAGKTAVPSFGNVTVNGSPLGVAITFATTVPR
ncbi:MAG: ice-binding family protein, partial [Thermoplasmata archaeon]